MQPNIDPDMIRVAVGCHGPNNHTMFQQALKDFIRALSNLNKKKIRLGFNIVNAR